MLKKYIFFPVLIVTLILLADISVYFVYPDVSALKKAHLKETAFMEHRKKQWEKEGVDKKIVQKWVPLKKVSPYLIKAVIIAEDDKFWRHEGFDFIAMQKALEKDLKKKKFKAGGSTITQQLAKNLYLSPSKNPVRKTKEAILAWRMERTLSKKRIVELYLNAAEWGDGIFGIQAAARHYYGKNASALTAEEAARLASVLPNPIRYNPIGKKKYVLNRSKYIYRIMVRRGIVIPEYEEVINASEETELAQSGGAPGEGLIGEADTTGLIPHAEEEQNTLASLPGEVADTTGPAAPPEKEKNGYSDAGATDDKGNSLSAGDSVGMAGKTP
jgi:monofunctional glycosyltransferase